MKNCGIEIGDFAQRNGFSRATVFNWLKLPFPPGEFVYALCKETGMTMKDFWDDGEGSTVNPVITPIVEELNYVAEHYSKAEQRQAFIMIIAALKSLRTTRDGK